MKFLSSASIIAVAAGVTNAQRPQDPNSHIPFLVQKFTARGIPHSNNGLIDFHWSLPNGQSQTQCNASPAVYLKFPTVAMTPCAHPSTSFSLEKSADGGAILKIQHEMSSGKIAVAEHPIKKEEIKEEGNVNPGGIVEVYSGPADFQLMATY